MTAERASRPAKRASKTPNPLRNIGPVEDLESHVRADWWREIFNANYLRTDGDVVLDADITRAEVDRFLDCLKVGPESRILDLCCGQGRHVLELAARGFTQLVGMDRSHYLINRARREARVANLPVIFKEGDARKLRFRDDDFDAVYVAGNSFGYFEAAADDERVLREVERVLKPGGQVLLDVTDGDYVRQTFAPRSWEWIDDNAFVCRERTLSRDGQRLVSREVITQVRKGVVADQFYAERLYSAHDLQRLLESCGFTDVSIESMGTESQRNQDLGMMAQRLVVTARVRRNIHSPRRRGRRDSVTVGVVLGDPRRRDVVKPDGVFDQDDFETLSRLKDALSELPQFQFKYFDDHSTLVDDLRSAKRSTAFVLNLCDEGFDNKASQELHVPALLEVLEIPYTGGTPQCLAYCYDKSLVRGIAMENDIPVPHGISLGTEPVNYLGWGLKFPVIVKPNYGDSSLGITRHSVCNDVTELEAALARVRERLGFDVTVLVESFLPGKDISVGIVGNPPGDYQVLPIIEECYDDLPNDLPKLCGYEAKWMPDSPYFQKLKSIPADLPADTERFLIASCVKLFQRLDCRDYARSDWRLDKRGTPRLLEVNPNPGWCWDSHLAKMASLAGWSYAQLLHRILSSAASRMGVATATASTEERLSA